MDNNIPVGTGESLKRREYGGQQSAGREQPGLFSLKLMALKDEHPLSGAIGAWFWCLFLRGVVVR